MLQRDEGKLSAVAPVAYRVSMVVVTRIPKAHGALNALKLRGSAKRY